MAEYSPSSEAIKKDVITCPICFLDVTNPVFLPCSHSFCLKCVQGILPVLVEGKHSINCPICRLPCPVPEEKLASSSEVYQIFDKKSTSCGTASNIYCGKVLYDHIPLIKQQSTITVSLTASDCSFGSVPCSVIKCHVTPPDNTPPIQCLVKEASQSGQYKVVFTPLTRGLHQLHLEVEDCTVQGSPVGVPVTVPPEMRDTPVKSITGLIEPSGIAMSDDGVVVVSETKVHRIAILDREGKKIRSFGSRGRSKGQFQSPCGVAVTLKGTILIADCGNSRIQEFTMEGDCVSCVGTKGNGLLKFNEPCGIAVNKKTGQVFVADTFNHRIQVLRRDLSFSHAFGTVGKGHGQFNSPHDVAIDSLGFVYVTDWNNHRVQKFTTEGQFINSFGTKGSNPGQLYCPSGITVDDNDLLYISNGYNYYVTVYTTDGYHVTSINKKKKAINIFAMNPMLYLAFNGIAFANDGQVWVYLPYHSSILIM